MKPAYDAANRGERPSPEQVSEQLDRILRSGSFRNAPALQRLLQYVTSKSTEGQLTHLKEYTIGIDVFGRGNSYDPKVDPVVRVEMHRIRQKLREYYQNEGANDPIFVEIPTGHYVPSIGIRNSLALKQQPASQTSAAVAPPMGALPESGNGNAAAANQSSPAIVQLFTSHPTAAIAVVSVAAALVLAGVLLKAHWSPVGPPHRTASVSTAASDSPLSGPEAAVHDFWVTFLGKDRTPIIGYANAVFLIDRTNDLFRFRRGASDNRGSPVDPHLAHQFASNPSLVARAGPLFYEYSYTGTGDVEAVWRFTRLFSRMGYDAALKRSRLVTIHDLQEHNVILIGSSFQNDAVAQLPSTGQDFVYEFPKIDDELWNGRIVNRHPLAGEAPFYKTERDKLTQTVKEDYALITVEPGIVPGRYIAVVGGLDTSGCSGATEFLNSASGIAEITSRLASLGAKQVDGQPPFFQALIKVDLENGLDVLGYHLLAVHPLHIGGATSDSVHHDSPPSATK
ncbi:MAG TPA: hypothetical protein VF749_17140 [Candidatus Acidoferrum sp.]